MIKGVLQSPRLKYHTKTIGIDQSLSNRASFEHNCLNNIKYIYQHSGKCDDQQNFKDILEADMVSNLEEITDDSPSFPVIKITVKTLSARKSLPLFTNIFDVQKRISIRTVGAAKPERKYIKAGSRLFKKKQDEKVIQKSMIRLNVSFIHG